MPRICRVIQFILLVGVLSVCADPSFAQDPELLRRFDYDQKAPLNIKQIGVQHREHADVYDISY